MLIEVELLDANGVLIEKFEGTYAEVSPKVAEFIRLHGGDGQTGNVVFRPAKPAVDQSALVIVNRDAGLVYAARMPPGVRVIVRDYDYDEADEKDTVTDEDGDRCVETEWFADGSSKCSKESVCEPF